MHRCVKMIHIKHIKSRKERLQILQEGHGQVKMSTPTVFRWLIHFREQNTKVVNDSSDGRQSNTITDVTNEKAYKLLMHD